MNKNQIEMIQILSKQNQPMTSSALASALQVSSPSIKNYVHESNGLYGKSIIISSRNGYSLNPGTNISLLISNDEDDIPQTNEERAYYIIKQRILNRTSDFDLFDLADYLCIGYSTLKSLISKMNKMFSTYDVEFVCENDILRSSVSNTISANSSAMSLTKKQDKALSTSTFLPVTSLILMLLPCKQSFSRCYESFFLA